MPSLDKFLDYCVPEPNSGCWLWLRSRLPRGYGVFCADGRTYRAHRWSYERFIGPVPLGLVLDHKCRTPSCVNPEHLEAVTQRENILRGTAPAARQARQTHCIHGHLLSSDNTYLNPDGRRQCKACRRRIDRRRRPALGLRVAHRRFP